MATLQLIWDGRGYDMWSWTMGEIHHAARTMRRIRNNVYLAHFGPRGTQPDQVVIAKMARGGEEMHALTREAEFYMNELRPLQGTVVPRLHGFFRGKEHGIDLGCLLLEHCFGYMAISEQELEDQSRAVMLAVCKLHQAGIVHGSLGDNHHIVRMGGDVRIIDFSLAVRHRCPNSTPVLTGSNKSRRGSSHVAQCHELALLERTYGFRSDRAAERRSHRQHKLRS